MVKSDWKDTKILEMEQKLKVTMEKFMKLQMEYNEYRKESTSKFSKLSEIKERKISELQSINSQFQSQEKAKEQVENIALDITNYEKRIQILEDRNQMFAEENSKHEIDNRTLREEVLDSKLLLRTSENRIQSLQSECSGLREENDSLRTENQALHTRNIVEKMKQKVKQLDDPQSRFQEEIESLKRQSKREVEACIAWNSELLSAQQKKMTENNKELEKLRAECHMLRENAKVVYSKQKKYMEDLHQFKLAKDKVIESMESRFLEQAAIIRESDENRQECERKLLDALKMLEELQCCVPVHGKCLCSGSEVLNDSTPVINQTMTSNRSSQLSPARPQENPSAVFESGDFLEMNRRTRNDNN